MLLVPVTVKCDIPGCDAADDGALELKAGFAGLYPGELRTAGDQAWRFFGFDSVACPAHSDEEVAAAHAAARTPPPEARAQEGGI